MQLQEVAHNQLITKNVVLFSKMRPSISPRTWDILYQLSMLFFGMAVQPIVSFIAPKSTTILIFHNTLYYFQQCSL